MADKNEKGWRLRRIALIAYAVTTALGFFYGNAYYDYFGIDLLDYASPIDLLFIGLANPQIVFAALAAPLLFLSLWTIGFVMTVVLTISGVALVMTPGWMVFAICVFAAGILAFPVAIVRGTALRAYWLKAAFAAVRTAKRKNADQSKSDARQGEGPQTMDEPLRLPAAYQQQKQHVPAWKAIDPQTYLNFAHGPLLASLEPVTQWGIDLLSEVLKIVPRTLRGIRAAYCFFEDKDELTDVQRSEYRIRFKSWTAIEWPHKLVLIALVLLFLAYLLFAASRLGAIDAQEIYSKVLTPESCLKDATKCDPAENRSEDPAESMSIGFWDVAKVMLPLSSRPVAPNSLKAFVIPTGNVASLDFSECLAKGDADSDANGPAKNDERRQLGRVNFRQDAGGDSRHGTPECLLRLGGIGSWQFLADIPGSYERKGHKPERVQLRDPYGPPFVVVFDEQSGTVSTPACDLRLATLVGPFPTGKEKLEEEDDSSKSTESTDETNEVGLCGVPGSRDGRKIKPVGINAAKKGLIGSSTEIVVLVGRADIRPIHNDDFKSNMELATKRVNWVKQELKSLNDGRRSLSVLSIPGGPADSKPHNDPCSRVVEIYTCPADKLAHEDA